MSHYISREGEKRTTFQVKIVAWKKIRILFPPLQHSGPILIHKLHSLKWIMSDNKDFQADSEYLEEVVFPLNAFKSWVLKQQFFNLNLEV